MGRRLYVGRLFKFDFDTRLHSWEKGVSFVRY